MRKKAIYCMVAVLTILSIVACSRVQELDNLSCLDNADYVLVEDVPEYVSTPIPTSGWLEPVGIDPNDDRYLVVRMAQYPHYTDIYALTGATATIFRGRVVDTRVEPLVSSVCESHPYRSITPLPHTIYTFYITAVYVGDVIPGEYIEITLPFGETEDTRLMSLDHTPFSTTHEYVVFVNAYTNMISPTQAAYIFNPLARSIFEPLESVSSQNQLTLTYDFLLNLSR